MTCNAYTLLATRGRAMRRRFGVYWLTSRLRFGRWPLWYWGERTGTAFDVGYLRIALAREPSAAQTEAIVRATLYGAHRLHIGGQVAPATPINPPDKTTASAGDAAPAA